MAISLALNYEAGIRAYDQAVDKGEASLIRMGFPPAERPVDEHGTFADRPTLPPKLSTLSMPELQDLMGWFTAWHSYALEALPQVTAERNSALNKKDFAWSAIRAEKRGKTTKDKDDETRVDARYIQVSTEFETADYRHKVVSAVCRGLEREIDTISRAQSALEKRFGGYGKHVGGERAVVRTQNVMNVFRSRREGRNGQP